MQAGEAVREAVIGRERAEWYTVDEESYGGWKVEGASAESKLLRGAGSTSVESDGTLRLGVREGRLKTFNGMGTRVVVDGLESASFDRFGVERK